MYSTAANKAKGTGACNGSYRPTPKRIRHQSRPFTGKS